MRPRFRRPGIDRLRDTSIQELPQSHLSRSLLPFCSFSESLESDMATSEQHSGSKETTVILVNSLLLGLATIAIGIRLLTRGVYLKSFGIDDGE